MEKIIGAASPAHRKQMERLLIFSGADSIRYVDHGNNESYFLTKGGRTLLVKACYNRIDKGFLSVSWENDDGDA